jgi:hypothetical protein
MFFDYFHCTCLGEIVVLLQADAVAHFHCALFGVNFRQLAAGWNLLLRMELRNI